MPRHKIGPTRTEGRPDPYGGALGSPVPPGEFVMRLLESLIRSQTYMPGDPDLAAVLETNSPGLYRTYVGLVAGLVDQLEAQPPEPDDAVVAVPSVDEDGAL